MQNISTFAPGGGGAGGGGTPDGTAVVTCPFCFCEEDDDELSCSMPLTSAATASSSCFRAVSACLLNVPPVKNKTSKLNKAPLRAVNTLMRKGLGHAAVSTIKVSSVTL